MPNARYPLQVYKGLKPSKERDWSSLLTLHFLLSLYTLSLYLFSQLSPRTDTNLTVGA
ncbi:unnamed protein product [Linum tenue]|uniref:Uncharacterized protein n=1 Tax=Linum tenue TaxID=586396 RepID=A0AAV0RY58_9ROSI|nr:unnamed protein product [Linum tenue]